MELLSWNSLDSLNAFMCTELKPYTSLFPLHTEFKYGSIAAMQLPEPFSFIFTWFAALPLIFWVAQAITNAIIKDFLILKVYNLESHLHLKKIWSHSGFDSKSHLNEFLISRAPVQTVAPRIFPSLELYWMCLAVVLKILWNAPSKFSISLWWNIGAYGSTPILRWFAYCGSGCLATHHALRDGTWKPK